MSDPHGGKPFPKGVLYAAGFLILTSLVFTGVAQTTGLGKFNVPQAASAKSVDLRFEDLAEEGLVVRYANSQEVFYHVPAEEDGFVRGVLRGINRTRQLEGLENDSALRLTKWEDGRLSIADPQTRHSVELQGFGPTNLAAFEKILEAAQSESFQTPRAGLADSGHEEEQ